MLKGSEIASNTIVGANSTVSGKFLEDYCVIAGAPARIVKKNLRRKL